MTMVEKARRASIPVGALGLDPAFVRELFAHGPDFLAHGIDTILMDQKQRSPAGGVWPGGVTVPGDRIWWGSVLNRKSLSGLNYSVRIVGILVPNF